VNWCRLAYGLADATATDLSLASVKSRLGLPFWYRFTRVVPEKGPLNVCVYVYAIAITTVTDHLNDAGSAIIRVCACPDYNL